MVGLVGYTVCHIQPCGKVGRIHSLFFTYNHVAGLVGYTVFTYNHVVGLVGYTVCLLHTTMW